MIYWDSSALIKKYLREDGSAMVLQWLAEDPLAATSQISYAEIHAAFARKLRDLEITAPVYRRICQVFESDWKAMVQVRLDEALLSRLRPLLVCYPLRSADALHLASALYLSGRLREKRLAFACSDKKLIEAAEGEGLRCWDPVAK